ncbi:hypothetical protein ES708_17597 [subsurface metagenome]
MVTYGKPVPHEQLEREERKRQERKSSSGNTIGGWLSDTADTVNDAVNSAGSWLNNLVNNFAQKADDAVSDAGERANDYINNLAAAVKDAVNSGGDWLNDYVNDYAQKADDAVSDGGDIISAWFGDEFTTARRDLEDDEDDVKDDADDWLDTIKQTVEHAGAGVTSNVQTFVDKAGGIINMIEMTMGIGFDVAMAALGGLPSLLLGMKADLASWFEIDVDKLVEGFKAAQEKVKPEE